MSMQANLVPFDIINGLDGKPLVNGYVYIGVENLDPITNPVQVFYDQNLTTPAAQPLRTIGGYISRNGAPAKIYVSGNYSVLVKTSANVQVYYSASSALGNGISVNNIVFSLDNYAQLQAYAGSDTLIYIAGRLNKQDGADGTFAVDSSDTTSADNGGTIIVDVLGRRWKRQYSGALNAVWFGAKGDALDGSAALNTTAINKCLSLGDTFIPNGEYVVSGLLVPPNNDKAAKAYSLTCSQNTILRALNSSTVILQKLNPTLYGRIYNWVFNDLVFKPCAAGNSVGLNASGFTNCTFNRPRGISNGLKGFTDLFLLTSPSISPTYFNNFNSPTLEGTDGYISVFKFDDLGVGELAYPNANNINSPVIFNNTGLNIAIDCNKSYSVTIMTPYIEANTSCTAISMGESTLVLGGAIEANSRPFIYMSGAKNSLVISTTLTNNTLNTSFSSVGAIGNTWILVGERTATGDTLPWINGGTTIGNRKITCNTELIPAIPALITTGGNLVSSVVASSETFPLDTFTKELSYKIVFNCNVSGASLIKAVMADVAGNFQTYSKEIQSFSVVDAAGVPVTSAVDSNGYIVWNAASAQVYKVTVNITYKLNRGY